MRPVHPRFPARAAIAAALAGLTACTTPTAAPPAPSAPASPPALDLPSSPGMLSLIDVTLEIIANTGSAGSGLDAHVTLTGLAEHATYSIEVDVIEVTFGRCGRREPVTLSGARGSQSGELSVIVPITAPPCPSGGKIVYGVTVTETPDDGGAGAVVELADPTLATATITVGAA